MFAMNNYAGHDKETIYEHGVAERLTQGKRATWPFNMHEMANKTLEHERKLENNIYGVSLNDFRSKT